MPISALRLSCLNCLGPGSGQLGETPAAGRTSSPSLSDHGAEALIRLSRFQRPSDL